MPGCGALRGGVGGNCGAVSGIGLWCGDRGDGSHDGGGAAWNALLARRSWLLLWGLFWAHGAGDAVAVIRETAENLH